MKPYKKNWNKGYTPYAEIFYNPKKGFNIHFSNTESSLNFFRFLLRIVDMAIGGEIKKNLFDTDKNRKKKK